MSKIEKFLLTIIAIAWLSLACFVFMSKPVAAATIIEDFESTLNPDITWSGYSGGSIGVGCDPFDGCFASQQPFSLPSGLTGVTEKTLNHISVKVRAVSAGGVGIYLDGILSSEDIYTVHDWTTITASGSFTSFSVVDTEEHTQIYIDDVVLTAVPVPAAALLFGAGLIGLAFIARREI